MVLLHLKEEESCFEKRIFFNIYIYILNYEVLNHQLNHIWWNGKDSSEILRTPAFQNWPCFDFWPSSTQDNSPWVMTKLDIFKESPFMMSLQLLEIDFNLLYVVTVNNVTIG